MGMTRFTTDIFPKGSYTYRDPSHRHHRLRANSGSGTCSLATLRRLGFVWLFCASANTWRAAQAPGNGLPTFRRSLNSYFNNCSVSSMIGVLRQNIETFWRFRRM